MRQSNLFTRTRREAPKDEVAKNASLLIRGGFIDKLSAGVYTYLPLGFIVLKKIENIIREEINKVGAQEVLMPSLHPKELWLKTGRWDKMTDLFKVTDCAGKESALAPTHEETVVPLAQAFVQSYKDLPMSIYQFQNKFRMELRAKSGVLRAREFIMKDMYSFHADEKDMSEFYEKMADVYESIFKRLGIGDFTYKTYASGGTFSRYSHEFQMLTSAGEDTIYLCEKCKIAVNKEIIDTQKVCPKCGKNDFTEKKAVEVGNIFELKTKFTEPFQMKYKDEKGKDQIVVMGCYGIGLGRVMGAIVEALSDDNGIIWPEQIAPFKMHLVAIFGKDANVKKEADALYEKLTKKGISALYDDREMRPGEKFSDSDLIGIPYRVVVSEKTIKEGVYEVKERKSGKVKMMSEKDLLNL